jgi:hypothetical protein
MRQWWRRVGSWWIAALVVLLVLDAFLDWHLISYGHAERAGKHPTLFPSYFVLKPFADLCLPLAELLWVVAGIKASEMVTKLTADTASISEGLLRSLRFRAALAQGLVPFSIISICIISMMIFPSLHSDGALSFSEILALPAHIGSAIGVVIPMLWVFVLLAFTQVKRWFAIAWFLGVSALPWILSPLMLWLGTLGISFGSVMPQKPDLGVAVSTCLAAVGLVFFYSIPVLLSKGKTRLVVSICSAYLITLLFRVLTAGAQIPVLSVLGFFVAKLSSGLRPVWLHYIVPYGEISRVAQGDAYASFLGYHIKFAFPPALAFLTLIVAVAVFAVHYYALRWIMLNVQPVVPKQKQQPRPV